MAEEKQDKPKIVPGYRVGMLTVEEATPQRKNGYTIWQCRCDCGGEILLDTRCLQRKTVKDCGCTVKVKPGQKDLTGMRFGKLVCIEPTTERSKSNRGTVWRCRCDCGNECLAPVSQLTVGYKKSCGCNGYPPREDLTGRVLGRLTVIGPLEDKPGYWKCKCECGNETAVKYDYLVCGHTKSCGCLQKTQIIENLKLVDGTSVTKLEAGRKKLIASNTSGYNGVYLDKKNGKWRAQISFKRKKYSLGRFDKIEDAVKARQRGEEMYDDFLEWYYSEYLKPEKTPDET